MENLKIVVIGGVACGPKAASRAKRCNPDAQVTLVEKGKYFSYGGCGLPYYVGSNVRDLNELMSTSWGAVRDAQFMKDTKDVDVMMGWEAIKINRAEKTVEIKNVEDGEIRVLPYDKLVLATGSRNFKPPIENIDAKGIFSMKTPGDAEAMQKYIKENEIDRAVIIGAGMIGMEVGEACSNWGIDVTVIEMKSWIFPQMLDQELAETFQHYLEGEGMTFMLDTKVEGFTVDENGAVNGVKTDKGLVDAQIVLVSVGVRSNIQLAVDAGLAVDKAILVNDEMQTSDPDIYAGGDCVMNKNRITGETVFAAMGSTANKHGRIIGTNVCGGHEKFPGILGTSVVKMFDWHAAKSGLVEADCKRLGIDYITAIASGSDITHFMPGKKNVLTRFIADKNTRKLLGVQVIGPGNVDKRVDTIAMALAFGATVDDVANVDLAYAPPFSSAMDNLLVAANVTRNTLDGRAKSIRYHEALAKIDSDDVVFVDLRVADGFLPKDVPAKNKLHIPIEQLRKRVNEIPKDKEIILYCSFSTRGFEAQLILEHAGFKDVKFLQGGVNFWPKFEVIRDED